MARRYRGKSKGSVWLLLLVVMALAAAGWTVTELTRRQTPSPAVDTPEWVVVRRDDLDTTLLAGGDLQPSKQATVTCQVEDVTGSDGTMILSVIKNGATVKKGDELCRLDSSALEELAREQEILVNQARALCLKAELDLETARIALREYEEGLVIQSTKEFQARIALGRSDTKRQEDRLAWSEAMAVKGYLAEGQLLSERQTLARARHELATAEGQFQLFQRFQAPKEIHVLRGQIAMASNSYRLEAEVLKFQEDELAYLRKQIDNCTIRAPQDGVVVHANRGYWWTRPLEPGTRVYQEVPMFLIPDLSQMEVDVSVHETMGPRVKVGMKADVRIASRTARSFRAASSPSTCCRSLTGKNGTKTSSTSWCGSGSTTRPGVHLPSCRRQWKSTPARSRTPSSSRPRPWPWWTAKSHALSSLTPASRGA